jgi:hypothetical protein
MEMLNGSEGAPMADNPLREICERVAKGADLAG